MPLSNKLEFSRPLDWGLRLALRNIPAIIILALISAALQIFILILDERYRLDHSQAIILAMLSMGLGSWTLLTCFLLLASQLNHRPKSVASCALNALGNLPKTILSSIAVAIIAGGLLQFIWPSFLIVFLIWAPLFCAAELLVEEKPQSKRLRDEDYDEASESEDFRPPVFFKNMPLWNLGLSRSIALMANRRAFFVGLQLMLFSMAIAFSGTALILKLSGDRPSLILQMLEAAISGLSLVLIIFIYCGAFFYLLPKEATKEIELYLDKLEKAPSFKIQGNTFVIILATLLTFASIKTLFDWRMRMESKPADTSFKLSKTEITPQQLIISVEISDSANMLSWIRPDSFKLETFEGTSAGEKIEKEKLLPTDYRSFRDSNGKEISEEEAIPNKEPITLTLHFENRLAPNQSRTGFSLVYSQSQLANLANAEDKLERVLIGQIGEVKSETANE